jgi:hypothetical protein
MTPCRVARLVGAPLLLVFGLEPRVALACSYSIPPPVEPHPGLVGIDVTAPVLTAVRLSGLERGIPGTAGGCLTHSFISLEADASDDLTRPEELAYRVETVSDDAPSFYDWPMSDMYFTWEEEPTKPLDLVLRVRAVDQAGNESDSMDIHVTDGVEDDGGCSIGVPRLVAPRCGATPANLALLAALGWGLRRRRPRR